CWLEIQNSGTGLLTITPSLSTIDGAASLQLALNQGVRIVSAGTTYLTERGEGSNGIGNCVLAGSNNDQLSCATLGSNDASLPGQLSLYELGANGQDYFRWAAPPSIPASYTAQLPPDWPSGQVMQFGAPDRTGIATGQWITLGPIA